MLVVARFWLPNIVPPGRAEVVTSGRNVGKDKGASRGFLAKTPTVKRPKSQPSPLGLYGFSRLASPPKAARKAAVSAAMVFSDPVAFK